MDTALHEHALLAARRAAEDAARLLLRHFSQLSQARISTKSNPADLVSQADIEAEALLQDNLRRALPEAGFIGEESNPSCEERAALIWVVDPLDGTSNFLCGLPVWSISIGLCDAQLRPLVGVVSAPALRRVWWATVGQGCRCNGLPCAVRSNPPGGGEHNAMLATGFPYAVAGGRDDASLANFLHMQKRFHKIRRMGSAAIDLALVAQGVFDGMWELQLQAWDVAAGMLLVTEAGGCVSRFDGSPYTPGDADMLAAGSPQLLDTLSAELRKAARSGAS